MRNRLILAGLGATAAGMAGAAKFWWDRDERHSPTSTDRMTPTTKTIVVNRAPEDVYQFWLDFENFPRFMKSVASVTVRDNGHSHWIANGPLGRVYEWEAELVENRPRELISWRSLPGADVDNAGSVRFERAPGGRGTLVRVNLRYDVPGGTAGAMAASLFGAEPGQEVQEDLRRFKQVMETGEVVRSDASIHPSLHNAQPPEERIPLQPAFGTTSPSRSVPPMSGPDSTEPRRPVERSSPGDDVLATPARGGAR